MPIPVALVTGATGAVGPSLVSRLVDNGYEVRAFSRTIPSPNLLRPGVTHYRGSLEDTGALDAALAGVDIVFHLAALLHIETPGLELTAQYQRINVDGTRALLERAANASIKRVVYFSTVKVYGVCQRIPITEEHVTVPQTIYARTKLEAEQILQHNTRVEYTLLRLSPVYGPRLKGSWSRLVRAIASGHFIPIGNLQNVHSLTHADDVAQAALIAAEHPDAKGKVFNLVGHEMPTMHDILEAIYVATNKPMPRIRIPYRSAQIGVNALGEIMSLIGKNFPLSNEALQQLTGDEAYSGLALRELGFLPQVDISEGWTTSSLND